MRQNHSSGDSLVFQPVGTSSNWTDREDSFRGLGDLRADFKIGLSLSRLRLERAVDGRGGELMPCLLEYGKLLLREDMWLNPHFVFTAA